MKRIATIFLCLLLLAGCSGGSSGSGKADGIYEEIVSSENISLDEAIAKLEGTEFDDVGKKDYVQKLKDLFSCEGQFVQRSESSKNRYNATVAYYLLKGEPYMNISYSGYMGTISDGSIERTTDDGYLFVCDTKGDLYGREQDFRIYIAEDKLRITWADGTCDYTLDRGDGSIESVQDYHESFDETDVYTTIVDTLDSSYADFPHHVGFDRNEGALNIYFEAMDGLRNALMSSDDAKLHESWNTIADAMASISESYATVVKASGGGSFCNVYWVDKLNDGDSYSKDDYLLWLQNGEIKYNFVDDKKQTSSSSSSSSSSGSSNKSSSSSSSSGGFTSSTSYKEIKSMLSSEFADSSPKFDYNAGKNTFTMTLTAPSGVHNALDAKAENVIYAWIDYTSNLAAVSEAGYEMMCEDGYSNIAFIIMVCSDRDSSICMYATMNGVDYYNILYD